MQPGGGPSGSSRSSPATSPRPDQPPTPASAQPQLGFRGQVGLACLVCPLGFEFILGGGFFFRPRGGRCDWWGTVRLRPRAVVGIREKISAGRAEKAASLRGFPPTVTRAAAEGFATAPGCLSCLAPPCCSSPGLRGFICVRFAFAFARACVCLQSTQAWRHPGSSVESLSDSDRVSIRFGLSE
ncbi:hypothetical protein BS78_04G009900 [Paspalum vaginatum]|nr:hypothetical protein BS78_04G009900 [Paspalum vaginatum]